MGVIPANDKVPVLAKLHWDHWLNIQHILRSVSRSNPSVEVILHGNADETGDGILRRFSQRVGIDGCRRRLFRGNLSPLRSNRRILGNQRRRQQEKGC